MHSDASLLNMRSITDFPCGPLNVKCASLCNPFSMCSLCFSHKSKSHLALVHTWVSWECLVYSVSAICGALLPILVLKSPQITVGYYSYNLLSTFCTYLRFYVSFMSLYALDALGGKYTLAMLALLLSGRANLARIANSFVSCISIFSELLMYIAIPPLTFPVRLDSSKLKPGILGFMAS